MRSKQEGFTLVELLIATTVFSVVLLVAAAALIQISRLYYKGIITSRTQGVTRTVMDDVSRTIQFSSGSMIEDSVGTDPMQQVRCFGTTRYTYAVGVQVSESVDPGNYNAETRQMRHALWQDTIPNTGACGEQVPNLRFENPYEEYDGVTIESKKGRELLSNDMRLQTFDIVDVDGNSDLYRVTVKVIYYSAPDLLAGDFNNPSGCKGSLLGGQWCAFSELSSVVYSRAT